LGTQQPVTRQRIELHTIHILMLILPDSLVVASHEGGSYDVVVPGRVGAQADNTVTNPVVRKRPAAKYM